jgi:hypothetical protein
MNENWRFRSTWLGKLVLQRRIKHPSDNPASHYYRWRDATTEDLTDFIKENA